MCADEFDQLRTESDRSINIDAIASADAVDPVYHTGKTHYLVPDGPVGRKPYSRLRQKMAASKKKRDPRSRTSFSNRRRGIPETRADRCSTRAVE